MDRSLFVLTLVLSSTVFLYIYARIELEKWDLMAPTNVFETIFCSRDVFHVAA